MPNPDYPQGTVRRLLQTALVTPKTREELQKRLNPDRPTSAPFFDNDAAAILRHVCVRLFPRNVEQQGQHGIDLALDIDERLASGKTNGWRYDSLPPDGEAYGR